MRMQVVLCTMTSWCMGSTAADPALNFKPALVRLQVVSGGRASLEPDTCGDMGRTAADPALTLNCIVRLQVVPGGRVSLVLVGVLAGGVVANQLLTTVLGS